MASSFSRCSAARALASRASNSLRWKCRVMGRVVPLARLWTSQACCALSAQIDGRARSRDRTTCKCSISRQPGLRSFQRKRLISLTCRKASCELRGCGISRSDRRRVEEKAMKRFVVASAALVGALTMLDAGESLAQQSITVSSWGGAFQKAQREAWFSVVEKELGITVKEDTTSGVADIRAQVASGRPTWDLSTQGAHTCGILEKEGKLEKLDAAIVNDAGVPKDLKT